MLFYFVLLNFDEYDEIKVINKLKSHRNIPDLPMECCLRRAKTIEKRPTTFCCGCGLSWGVFTVAAIYTSITLDGVLRGSPAQVLTMLFFLSPIAAIPVFPDNRELRTMAFLQQWLVLILLIVLLLAWAVAMETYDFGDYVCGLHDGILWREKSAPFNDQEQCIKEAKDYLILAWVVAFVAGVPLQIFAVTFFKAFRDNL